MKGPTTTYHRGEELAVPAELVEQAGIEDGEELVFEKRDGAVVLRRALTSDAVDGEIAAGEFKRTHSLEDFFAELDSDDEPERI